MPATTTRHPVVAARKIGACDLIELARAIDPGESLDPHRPLGHAIEVVSGGPDPGQPRTTSGGDQCLEANCSHGPVGDHHARQSGMDPRDLHRRFR